MRIGVAATGESLDANVCEHFGRAPYFVIVESDTLAFEGFPNACAAMHGGAGPSSAQEMARRGAELVLAGQFGPKAQWALEAAGVRYAQASGTVRDAVARCHR